MIRTFMTPKPTNLPLRMNASGMYYGWVIVVFGTLGVIMSVPGQTMGISVYTEYFLQSLPLDRVDVSMAYMLGTMASALLLPYAGRLLDLWGARRMSVIAFLGLALFLFLLSHSPDLSDQVVQWTGLDPVWVAFFVMFVCFLGVRHFGQGQVTMVSRTMMGLWFERRRGLVLGASGSFVGLGFGIAPLVLTKSIEALTWQHSLRLLCWISLGMMGIAFLTYRRSPEHCGLEVDGGLLKSKSSDTQTVIHDEGVFTVKEAKATRTFWIYAMAMTAQALLVTAITFHLTDIGRIRGVDQARAFSVFLPMSGMAILAELVGGYLSDRIRMKYLLAVKEFCLCMGLLGFLIFDKSFGFYLVAAGLGIGSGLFALLQSVAWPKLFGRTHLGSIMGLVTSLMVAGSAVGPYFFSIGKSIHGNYQTVIWICAILPAFLCVASFYADNPRKEHVTLIS